MGLTASNLKGHSAATFPTYASGDVTADEFNAITAEIKSAQLYAVKNWGALGFVNVLDYTTATPDSNGVWHITSTDVNAAIASSAYRNVIYIPANVMCNCDPAPIQLPTGKHLLGGMIVGTASLGGPGYPQGNVTTVYSTNGNDLVQCGEQSVSGGNGIGGIFFGDYQHYCVAIRLSTGSASWLNDGWIKDCWFARASIYAVLVQGWGMSRCVFDWTYGANLEMYGCENWRVSDNYFCLSGQGTSGSAAVTVGPYAGNGSKSISNYFAANHFTAGGLQGSGTVSHGMLINGANACTITGNHFAQNTGRGLWLQGGATNITIVGNQFEKNAAENVYIDSCSKVIVSGSSFNSVRRLINGTGVYPTEQNVPHIRSVGTCSRILVTGSTFDSDTRTTAVELSTGTTKSRVNDIILDGTVTTGVSDLNGTNSIGTVIS